MSQDNVAIVDAAYRAWNRGDVDAAVERTHPGVEFAQDRGIPGAVSLSGRSDLRDWLGSFQETWESFRILPERIEAVGERVLVVARIFARGRLSEAEVEQPVGHVLTLRDGEVVRWESYADVAEAVEAVGLSE